MEDSASSIPRLLCKKEVLRITGRTYSTIWSWMRAGTFPVARVVGGRVCWFAEEVEAWRSALPPAEYKPREARS